MKPAFFKKKDIEDNELLPSHLKNKKYHFSLVLLILFGGFLIWAFFVPLAKGVVVSGTMVVDSLRKTIQHLEGGMVNTIHVREGSRVQANDILIELDDTKARSERDMVRSRYFMKIAELNRLKALSEGKINLEFAKTLIDAGKEAQIAELLTLQTNLFHAMRKESEGRKIIAKHRVGQLEEKKKGLKAYSKIVQDQLSLLKKEVVRLQELSERKLIDSTMVIERIQMLSQQQGELSKTSSDIWETEVAISEASLSVLQIEREWQQELSKQLSETQEALVEMHSRLKAAQDVLDRTIIRAPLTGAVIGLKLTTVGGVIISGHPVMDIVPEDEKLVIEAHISPLDIDSIKLGMEAEIRLSSFRAKTTPKLKGSVENVSADALLDQTTATHYYLCRVKIWKDQLSKFNETDLVPGMPAEVFINAGSRTLAQYLFDPLSSIFRKGMRED